MSENDYLVVCPTAKMADYAFKQLRDYVLKHRITVIGDGGRRTLLIDSTEFHGIIRFVTEEKFFEVSLGFRGWVLEGYQVEMWVDAAEVYEKEGV